MKLISHFFISLCFALLCSLAFNLFFWQFLLIFAAGFAIDFDHVLDFIIIKKRIPSLSEMLHYSAFYETGKAYLLFHSFEVLGAFLLVSILFLPFVFVLVAINLLIHLALDCIFNTILTPRLLVYSLAYRVSKNFTGFASREKLKKMLLDKKTLDQLNF